MADMPEPSARGALIAGLTLAAFGVFLALQFAAEGLVGTDGFYHLKTAVLLARTPLADWPGEFPWLPLTVLAPNRYVDHHFLFHVLLVPFTWLPGLAGGKVAAAVFAALAFLAFQFALPRCTAISRIAWSLVYFACSPGFLYRMSMVRAQSLSLAMLFLLVVLLKAGRYRLLGVAAFVYVWMYNAFPLIIVLLVCFVVSEWIVAGKLPGRVVLWTLGGLLAGILVNPYFPENVLFLYHHLVDKFQPAGYAVKVGTEWYPYDAAAFMTHAGLAAALLGVAVWFVPSRAERKATIAWTIVLFAAVTLAMLLKSRRFVELFPPFAVLACAWALNGRAVGAAAGWGRIGAGAAALLLVCGFSLRAAWQSVEDSQPPDLYRASAEWLRENTPRGSMIFTADWDDFPRLFYWNDHNVYLAGLDPYFLYATDRARFHLWRRITQGKLKAPPGPLISGRFGARYIFLDKDHEDFRKQLKRDATARKVFESKDSYIYEITPAVQADGVQQ